MNQCEDIYKYNNKNYPLTFRWDTFEFQDLVVDVDKVRALCSDGCPNYNTNGGCPPFSPTVKELLLNKPFILLTAKVATKLIDIENLEEKSKYIDDLLCGALNHIGYTLKNSYQLDFLSPSHCRGCDVCTIKAGCSHPEKRVYSITGTGLMLSEVIENLFDEKLQWFSKDSEPEYIIKIMAIMRNENN